MTDKSADVIVVGGGVVGLWTAYHLAQQGVKTMVLEQFSYPHTRGSSHGQTRITRTSYSEPEYAALMPEAFQRWKDLQEQAGKELYINTGLLTVYDFVKKKDEFYSMLDNLSTHKVNHYVVPGESLSQSFPGLSFPAHCKGIFDADSGILLADQCTTALRCIITGRGVDLHEGEPVLSIKPINSKKVIVKTSKASYSSASVVLTCGAYINKLLETVNLKIPVQPVRVELTYWKDKSPEKKYSALNKFPCVLVAESPYYYSTPSHEYPGLIKISYHGGTPCDPDARDHLTPDTARESKQNMEFIKGKISYHGGTPCDPDARDHLTPDTARESKQNMEFIKGKVRSTFPDADASRPAITEMCMFSETPDSNFVLDFHPKHKNIVIGAGFSGHGFKTSPSVGHILANMALPLQPPYSLEPFSLKRFNTQSKL